MRLRLLLPLMLLSTAGCRAILGIDDDPPILTGSSGTSASSASGGSGGSQSTTSSGGAGGSAGSAGAGGGGGFDPHFATFPIPPDSPPSSNYAVNGATVVDHVTGLEWERSPPTSVDTHETIAAHCASLGDDWRVPSRIELQTIWLFSSHSTKIDETRFAELPTGNMEYWTTSADVRAMAQGYIWAVTFTDIIVDGLPDSDVSKALGRCVRTKTSHANAKPHYTKEAGGKVVRDNWTGLSWAFDVAMGTRNGAKSACTALDLGAFPSGWRVPSTKELLSLWDETRNAPPYWDDVFGPGPGGTNEKQTTYWSATDDPSAFELAFGVDYGQTAQPTGTGIGFNDGVMSRCVHD